METVTPPPYDEITPENLHLVKQLFAACRYARISPAAVDAYAWALDIVELNQFQISDHPHDDEGDPPTVEDTFNGDLECATEDSRDFVECRYNDLRTLLTAMGKL